MKQVLTVCLAADKNYLQHLMATMVSVLLNTDLDASLNFIILSDGSLNESDLDSLKKIRTFGLRIIDASRLIEQYIPIGPDQTWPLAAFYRLLLPFVCLDVDKVLYLDCDVIVRKPIRELWDTQIDDYSVAGVADAGYPHEERLMEAGVDISGNYFNSGVLLLNLDRIRSHDYEGKLDRAAQVMPIPAFADQCWLNIMFNHEKVILPIKWNVMSHVFSIPDEVAKVYSKRDVENAMVQPGICHFTNIKPWTMTYTEHPYWFDYWQVLKKTPYSNQILKGYFKKIFLSREDAVLLRFARPMLQRLKSRRLGAK